MTCINQHPRAAGTTIRNEIDESCQESNAHSSDDGERVTVNRPNVRVSDHQFSHVLPLHSHYQIERKARRTHHQRGMFNHYCAYLMIYS